MALFRWAVRLGTLLLATAGSHQAVARGPRLASFRSPMTLSAPGNSLAPTLAATRLGVSLDEPKPQAANASAARYGLYVWQR